MKKINRKFYRRLLAGIIVCAPVVQISSVIAESSSCPVETVKPLSSVLKEIQQGFNQKAFKGLMCHAENNEAEAQLK